MDRTNAARRGRGLGRGDDHRCGRRLHRAPGRRPARRRTAPDAQLHLDRPQRL